MNEKEKARQLEEFIKQVEKIKSDNETIIWAGTIEDFFQGVD